MITVSRDELVGQHIGETQAKASAFNTTGGLGIDLLTADPEYISVITLADMQSAITEVATANDITTSSEQT